ncbi:MAG TPA: hypothetical protein VKZ75_06705 [Cyclobacteriaceae bacterium]|nr:hypothetical protein [Cyclobacteriaceae bacterium]
MKSLSLKSGLPYLPEILLSIAVAISFLGELIETSNANYFLILCGLVLSILVVWKNKFFALGISTILGLVSFYMIFAVLSEYKEFPPGSISGLVLLFVGESIFVTLFVISIFLPIKYFTMNKNARGISAQETP